MPELPDVEIFKENFDTAALHKKIVSVEAQKSKIFTGITPPEIERNCRGQRFEETVRYGKYLMARLGRGGWIVFHFGMTGYLKYYGDPEDAPGHTILLFRFESGEHLAYSSRRRLGRIYWTDSPESFVKQKGLGPDPLQPDFSFEQFDHSISAHHGALKSLLMNQGVLAGIGNIYSDEILFQEGIHPKARPDLLDHQSKRNLYTTMENILNVAIAKRVGEKGWPKDWLIEHRYPGDVCPRCGGEIRKETIGGRSSYFCDHHQNPSNGGGK